MKDILVRFLTSVDFRQAENLDSLLRLFEDSRLFKPKKWQANDEMRKQPYSRQQVIQIILNDRTGYITPALEGNRQNPFEMLFFLEPGEKNPPTKPLNETYLRVEYPNNIDIVAEILAFSTDWADICQPETGYLLFTQENMRSLGWIANMASPRNIQKFGLGALGIRSWLGPHAIQQIGLKRLKSCGGVVRETNWGGVEVDLLDAPWLTDDISELIGVQHKIMAELQPSGVFGDYSQHPLPIYNPAPRWKPIPLEIT